MPRKNDSRWLRYAIAIALVVLATIVRQLLDPVMGDRRPMTTYLFAIMLVAWYCGSGPTLLAVFLSMASSTYFFLQPRGSLTVVSPTDQVSLLIFMTLGLFIALLTEQLYRAKERGEWQQLQRKGELALIESERRFRQLADAMPQMVWTLGPDGMADYYNERWYEYTGLFPEAQGDDSWEPAFHPDDVQRTQEAWKQAAESGDLFQIEYRLKDCRTGEFRWHLGRAVPSRDEKGRIVQWFGTSTDIDEQKKVEEKLRESERLYRAIGESIDYGVWVCDSAGKNLYASTSFLRLVGLSQEQCSEFGWSSVLHPDDSENTLTAWKECVRVRGKWDRELRFRGVDGQWHPILARGARRGRPGQRSVLGGNQPRYRPDEKSGAGAAKGS